MNAAKSAGGGPALASLPAMGAFSLPPKNSKTEKEEATSQRKQKASKRGSKSDTLKLDSQLEQDLSGATTSKQDSQSSRGADGTGNQPEGPASASAAMAAVPMPTDLGLKKKKSKDDGPGRAGSKRLSGSSKASDKVDQRKARADFLQAAEAVGEPAPQQDEVPACREPECEADVSERMELEERPETEVEDGAKYKGQWLGNKKHGHGTLLRRDGRCYEGQFVDGKAHGQGRFAAANGAYEGEWVNDQAHGHGKYEHTDGSKYVGNWAHDNKSGEGLEKWTDGSMYKGQFQDGFKHGSGVYTSASGTSYDGQFVQDKMDGHGSYKFPDGRAHIGQFRNGHMNGSGKMEWPSGCKYSGSYKNDQKHGEGTFKWADGRAYHGQWHNGKQHGNGVLVKKDGQEVRGVWQDGKMESSHAQVQRLRDPVGNVKAVKDSKQSKQDHRASAAEGSSDDDDVKAGSNLGLNRASADLALLAGRQGTTSAMGARSRQNNDLLLLQGASAASRMSQDPAAAGVAPCLTPDGSESEDEASPSSRESSPQAIHSPSRAKQGEQVDLVAAMGKAVSHAEASVITGNGASSSSSAARTVAQKIQVATKERSAHHGRKSDETFEIVLEDEMEDVYTDIMFEPGRLGIIFGDEPILGEVRAVTPGGKGYNAGIRPGWVIVTVAGESMIGKNKDIVEKTFVRAKGRGESYTVTFRHQRLKESDPGRVATPLSPTAAANNQVVETKKDDSAKSAVISAPPKQPEARKAANPLADMMQIAVDFHESPESDGESMSPKGKPGAAGLHGSPEVQVATPEVAQQKALSDNGVGSQAASAAGKFQPAKQKEVNDEKKDIALQGRSLPSAKLGAKGSSHRNEQERVPISGRDVRRWVYQLVVDYDVLQQVADDRGPPKKGGGCLPGLSKRAPKSALDVIGLAKALESDKDFVLYLSRAEVDFTDDTQWRILQSVQMALNKSKACAKTGRHWQDLGFESQDPKIDFSAKGGLLHLIHLFLWLSNYGDLAKVIYWFSIGKFKLASSSMDITQMIIEALLDGNLSTVCNQQEHGVFETTCQLHAACLQKLYSSVRDKDSTPRDARIEVRACLSKKPAKLLKDFEKALQEPCEDAHALDAGADHDVDGFLDNQQQSAVALRSRGSGKK